jgi:proteasome lid subunit RPN8/RPN11
VSPRVFSIRQHVLDAMVIHAREENPNECCGLLIGSGHMIEEGVRTTNLKASPTAYLIDPADHFAELRRARSEGRAILGAYHSHPNSPPVPSPTDVGEAYYPDFVYIIVSLELPVPQIRAYLIEGGNFTVVPLVSVPG